MDEPNYEHELTFETEHCLSDQIDGERASQKLKIYPGFNRSWSFTLLSTFLNELSDFRKPSRRGFITNGNYGLKDCRFCFNHDTCSKYFIILKISDTIEVLASLDWLKNKWERKHIAEPSWLRKGGKLRTAPVTQILDFFTLSFTKVSAGTKCLFSHTPIMYCAFCDFSNIFHFFAKNIMKVGLHNSVDTLSIHEYNTIFVIQKKKAINSLESLQAKLHGFIQFDIQESSSRRKLVQISYQGRRYYIIGGVYISPFAKSILQSGDTVKGILLDTTWKVMPMYVTSIIMAATMNIGIPLGFAFGSGEDKKLYEKHFEAFSQQTGINLARFVIESDQGSALKAICDEKSITHLACLRHFLVSLHYSAYSYVAGELVKCASSSDLQKAISSFNENFSEIQTDAELKELNAVLNKIGMQFKDSKIQIIDQKRWNEVSILSRIDFRMPSTTNSLESVHGHFNKKTPRNNNFWSSINRLGESFMLRLNSLNHRIQHNYDYTKRNTLKKMNMTSPEKMKKKQDFYHTTLSSCSCGENKLTSAQLNINIPCSHRCALGAVFPETPKLEIELNKQWNELKVAYNVIPLTQEIHAYDENRGIKAYAVNIIRKYSGYKHKEEIEKFVNENYEGEEETCFISGIEVSVIQMIYEGISKFALKKEEAKANKAKNTKPIAK